MIAIAIDGPSGAGKSTIARACAKKLGFIYVDTGALYRSIGLYALRQNVDTADADAVTALLPAITVDLGYRGDEQRVYLNGEDVSEEIRRPPVSMAASNVSAHPPVRAFLLDLQLDMAKRLNVIMDGRDIGTVVLPDATVKIFLTASPEARAKRRYDELIGRGETVDYDALLEEIIQRDYNDSHRERAPLRQADDAVLVDTTEIGLDDSIHAGESVIRKNANV